MSIVEAYRTAGAAAATGDKRGVEVSLGVLEEDPDVALACGSYLIGLLTTGVEPGVVSARAASLVPGIDVGSLTATLLCLRSGDTVTRADVITAAVVLCAATFAAGDTIAPFEVVRTATGDIVWITPPTP